MPAGDCQCPKIEVSDWRDREVTLAGQYFLSHPTPLFLHLPHRLYRDLEGLWARIGSGRYQLKGPPLVLHRDGWFSGELLVSVEPPPGASASVVTFQNLFYSRVVEKLGFDAALREMPRFYRDLRSAGVGRIESMYFWYLNCPRCLIDQGIQQVILLARSNKVLSSESCPASAAAAAPRRILPCGV